MRFGAFRSSPNDAHVRDGELWISYERSVVEMPGEFSMIESYPTSLHALIVVGEEEKLRPVLEAAQRVAQKEAA